MKLSTFYVSLFAQCFSTLGLSEQGRCRRGGKMICCVVIQGGLVEVKYLLYTFSPPNSTYVKLVSYLSLIFFQFLHLNFYYS